MTTHSVPIVERVKAFYLNDRGMKASRVAEVLPSVRRAQDLYNWRDGVKRGWEWAVDLPELSPETIAELDGLLAADGLIDGPSVPQPVAASGDAQLKLDEKAVADFAETGSSLALAKVIENGTGTKVVAINGVKLDVDVRQLFDRTLELQDLQHRNVQLQVELAQEQARSAELERKLTMARDVQDRLKNEHQQEVDALNEARDTYRRALGLCMKELDE